MKARSIKKVLKGLDSVSVFYNNYSKDVVHIEIYTDSILDF